LEDCGGGVYGDAADGDYGFARQFSGCADQVQAYYWVGIFFRGGWVDWAHSYIVRRSAVRGFELIEIVCRNSNPSGGGAEFSRGFYGEVFLAHVDACGMSDAGDVWPVVDDDAGVFWRGTDQGRRDFLELACGKMLGSELD
jgi:hypothetical protein